MIDTEKRSITLNGIEPFENKNKNVESFRGTNHM